MGESDVENANEYDPHVELDLLIGALEISPSAVEFVSREPLGAGSVAGFDVSDSEDTARDDTARDVADHDENEFGGAGATGAGAPTLRYYVDTSRLPVAQETGLALGDPESPDARIWLHPADPHLPALAPIAFHDAAASLLSRFGIGLTGAPVFVGYRPGRRAVLFVDASDRRIWVKVVRPSRVERLAATHAACDRAGLPVPAMLGWSPEGVILLENAVGTPAADVAWRADELLDRVDELRVQIARVESTQRVRAVADRLSWYVARWGTRTDADEVKALARCVRDVLTQSRGDRERRVVHGDLHFGQLFLQENNISGLIDVDTMGVGDGAEDPAAFLAHATVSAMMTPPESRERVWDLADAGTKRWGSDQTVRALFAIHMLGHALGAADRGEEAAVADLLSIGARVLAGGIPSR